MEIYIGKPDSAAWHAIKIDDNTYISVPETLPPKFYGVVYYLFAKLERNWSILPQVLRAIELLYNLFLQNLVGEDEDIGVVVSDNNVVLTFSDCSVVCPSHGLYELNSPNESILTNHILKRFEMIRDSSMGRTGGC